jgi:hypothetical protein
MAGNATIHVDSVKVLPDDAEKPQPDGEIVGRRGAEPQARFNASQVGRTRLNGKTGGAARLPQRPAGANESQEWRCVS